MSQSIEVIVAPDGNVQWKEPLTMKIPRRALVTFLDEEPMKESEAKQEGVDFDSWVGLGLKAPLNPNPRFKSDDDLWE